MESEQLVKGAVLQGDKYRIESVLGQGGFGITYLAVQELLKRKVAIKEFFMRDFCFRDGSTSSVTLGTASNRETMERYLSKFMKEAQTIAALDHPNIIHIHDIFKENNTAYYVMDYIEGESLSQRVKRLGCLPEDEAVGYIRAVAEALKYVHRRRINHLDVKPGNIMVRYADNRVFLLDFGLSKQYDVEGNQTSSTPVGISHGYAPIEQYRPGGVKEFSPQTDIYALGATLYYLLTGNTPPAASEMAETELAFPATLSPVLCNAIRQSMEFRKKDRPQDIDAFEALLPVGKKEETSRSAMETEDTVLEQTELHAAEPNTASSSPEVQKSDKEPEVTGEVQKGKASSGGYKAVGTILVVVAISLILFWLFGRPDKQQSVQQQLASEDSTLSVLETVGQVPVVERPDQFEYIKETREPFKVDVEYPVHLNGITDITELQLAIVERAFGSNNKDIRACVEKYFKKGQDELSWNASVSGEVSVKYKQRFRSLFVFEVSTYYDGGGGTGASIVMSNEYIYFNADTNRSLRINDIITDYAAALSIVNSHISLDEYNSKAESLPDNFKFSDAEITFIFPKYSIGYGYQGEVGIAVTYDELDSVLSDEFKHAIGRS